MARGAVRKLVDSLLIPLLALSVFIVIFALLVLCSIIYSWVGSYNPSVPVSLGRFLGQLPAASKAVLFSAVVATTLFLIYRIRKRPGLRLLSFLFALASVGALLFFGMAGLDRLSGRGAAREAQAVQPFVPQRFEVLRSATLYVERVQGTRLFGVAVVRPNADPAITFASEAQFHPKGMTIALPQGSLAVSPANPDFGPVFQPPPFLRALLSDMGWATAAVQRAFAASRLDFAIAAGAILLFCMSCMMLARLTRWPLLNALLTLVVFRGVFWVLPILQTPPAAQVERQIAAALHLSAWRASLPSFALILLGVIFILVDLTLLGWRERGDRAHG